MCFSYSNIGWLGIPIASSIFGKEASAIMIALYVGGSIFGNSFSSIAFNSKDSNFKKNIIKIIKSPPIISIIIAIFIKKLNIDSFLSKQYLDLIYTVAKFGMTFCGMCVLGMWLKNSKYEKSDFIESIYSSFLKFILGLIFVLLLMSIFDQNDIIIKNIYVILLIFILPPAANIVALETAYRKTGKSVNYIGVSTIISLIYILFYYLILKFIEIA